MPRTLAPEKDEHFKMKLSISKNGCCKETPSLFKATLFVCFVLLWKDGGAPF